MKLRYIKAWMEIKFPPAPRHLVVLLWTSKSSYLQHSTPPERQLARKWGRRIWLRTTSSLGLNIPLTLAHLTFTVFHQNDGLSRLSHQIPYQTATNLQHLRPLHLGGETRRFTSNSWRNFGFPSRTVGDNPGSNRIKVYHCMYLSWMLSHILSFKGLTFLKGYIEFTPFHLKISIRSCTKVPFATNWSNRTVVKPMIHPKYRYVSCSNPQIYYMAYKCKSMAIPWRYSEWAPHSSSFPTPKNWPLSLSHLPAPTLRQPSYQIRQPSYQIREREREREKKDVCNIYIYICIYLSIYIYIDIYACMHKRISIHIYTYICIDNFLQERERDREKVKVWYLWSWEEICLASKSWIAETTLWFTSKSTCWKRFGKNFVQKC